MKIAVKRFFAFFVAFVMSLSMIPISGSATSPGMTLRVDSVGGLAGAEVKVKLQIEGNPGISSIGLALSYDSILTLNSIEYNTSMGGQSVLPQTMTSPIKMIWVNGTANFTEETTTFATLTFQISDSAPDNYVADITVEHDPEDVYNIDEENVTMNVINGSVKVYAGVPGDINGDEKTNNKDVSRLMQYLAGWAVTVNEPALDTNGDGKVNNKDVSRLMQALAGWDVELFFGGAVLEKCEHTMEATAFKAATCTTNGNLAYWHCTKCGRFFSDATGKVEISLEKTTLPATGHTIVPDPAVPATYQSKGLTEGSHCSVCHEVLVEQKEYGPLTQNQYSIEYLISGNDAYLAKLTIRNPNPQSFTSEEGVTWLEDLVVAGYNFEGWFDGQGSSATRVTSIPVGTARNMTLYAKWTKEPYTITFDNSSMNQPSTTRTYTVDQKITLDKPIIDRYVFLGWTTDNDELVSEITPGTTGNFTLHSNWTSKRNLAKPVSRLGNPLIIEDTNEGKILFAYEIGQIENVPLYTIKNLPSAGNVVSVYTETTKKGIGKTDAATIAKAVDRVTTDSTAWTLSEDWNTTTHIEDSILEEHGYNRETGQEVGKTSSNTYTLTTNEYDNTIVKANDGTVATTTQYDTNEVDTRETWESKANLSVSDTESVKYTDSVQVSAEVGAGYGPVSAKVGASMESSTEISSSTTAGASAETTVAHENTSHSKTGTDKVTVEDKTKTTTNDKGWNKAETSSSTSSSSFTQYEKETLSNSIAKEYKYGTSYAVGGANSKSADWSTSTGESSQYSSTLTYFNSEETTEKESYTIKGETDGSYRLVRAGIVHVFAVVIYDIAEAAYSVATYDVLDDETYTYIDYSATSAAKFDDNENGILPFEIPYSVNDYVNGRIVSSEGIEINNLTGKTGSYTGNNTSVIIPEFISVDNMDNTHSAVTVRGLSEDTFKGNEDIKSVLLSNYIREIPASAFAGCTSLQFVLGSEIDSIGSYAFDGCTSLGAFKVASSVTSIGENAFRGVDSIEVTASNLDVVMGAIQSGAKHITINVSAINEDLENATLEIPNTVDTFELQGGRKNFSGLKIISDAGSTILNGINIKDSTSVPLTISSENITLNQVTVNAPNYVLLLKSVAPTLELYGTSVLKSSAENAVVCRNVVLKEIKSKVTAQLETTGNVLSCGTPVNTALLKFVGNGEIIPITEEEYDKYIKGVVSITLDANGGVVSQAVKEVIYGDQVGSLPTASRDYYTFDGWYTAASGGERVSANWTSNTDTILYAHWTNAWTEWSDTAPPSGYSGEATESRTLYRYRTKQTTTSTSSALSEWTQSGSHVEYGEWGGWSNWQPDSIASSDTRDVQTDTIYGYYYFTCPNCGTHSHGWGSGLCFTWSGYMGYPDFGGCGGSIPEGAWTQGWFTVPWAYNDWWGTGKYYQYIDGSRWFQWPDGGSARTGYRCRDRSKTTIYEYWKWGNWSTWSANSTTATSNRQVETKTQYRYKSYMN